MKIRIEFTLKDLANITELGYAIDKETGKNTEEAFSKSETFEMNNARYDYDASNRILNLEIDQEAMDKIYNCATTFAKIISPIPYIFEGYAEVISRCFETKENTVEPNSCCVEPDSCCSEPTNK